MVHKYTLSLTRWPAPGTRATETRLCAPPDRTFITSSLTLAGLLRKYLSTSRHSPQTDPSGSQIIINAPINQVSRNLLDYVRKILIYTSSANIVPIGCLYGSDQPVCELFDASE